MSFSSIPVVDFRRLQDPETQPAALLQLREAIFQVGFVYLSLVQRAHETLPELFVLPGEAKERCNMINSPAFVGYTRLGAETTASQTDLREQFDFGTPGMKPWTESDPFWQRLEGDSQYPDYPGAQELIEEYITASAELSQAFMRSVSECLCLPPTTFESFKGRMDRLKFIKYPPAPPGSQGDNIGGLQVLNRNGDWIDAPPIAGSLVVNIQQGFEAITGGGGFVQRPRIALFIPFFLGVRMDLTLDELRESAAHIVQRIPASDDRKKRAVDVPSEFLSPPYSCFGEAYLRNRIISHPDVGRKWYPDLHARYSQDSSIK
ncbi:hypothetical protein BDV25DRAFT_136851 [Aspergillus avenaceus]|uniref:Uncharacterized protein n=1 Tax=Aspergillus avenaceus TaxID=36643 RepID=A0A5N6U4J5_ASPAV|nr:hypothetical protein BDV25DRAFT_136851 [Aspergillus avenaceus]